MILPFEDLRRGRMYYIEVRYYAPLEGYLRLEMRALFTGEDDYGNLTFTLKPLSRFLALPKPWISKLEEARNKPPFLPRSPEVQL